MSSAPRDRQFYSTNQHASSSTAPPNNNSSSSHKNRSKQDDVATVFVRVRGDLPERNRSTQQYPSSRGGPERDSLPDDGCLEVLGKLYKHFLFMIFLKFEFESQI